MYFYVVFFYIFLIIVFLCREICLLISQPSIQSLYPWMRCIYMHKRSVQSLMQLLYPWVWCIYMQGCSVHSLIRLLFPWSMMGKINFYMQKHFLHSLIWLLYPWVWWCIYKQECSVHSLIHLLFPLVQCQCLKPVLSQCSQTGFVPVDDFIALYTSSYLFYSHGCNVRAWHLLWASVAKLVLWQLMILLPCTLTHTSSIPMGAMHLYIQELFFALADSITPIFTKITKVWTCGHK